MTRQAPSLRVQIGDEIVLRRGSVEVLACDIEGRPTIMHLRPQLRPGEILCERLGDIPLVLMRDECAALVPATPVVHFDTWMSQRTATAHAEFMERTSRQLRCDWSPLARAIDTYLNRTSA